MVQHYRYLRLSVSITGSQILPDLVERKKGPLQDVQRAIRVVRANVQNWGIKQERIGVQGSSAGGHLAALVSTANTDVSKINDALDTISFKPNFSILVSPVIDLGTYAHLGSKKTFGSQSSRRISTQILTAPKCRSTTCPAFLVHAFNDKSVNVRNSLFYYSAQGEHIRPG